MTILPIGQRDFDRFGIGYFINQGKNVTVLNIRELVYKNIPVSYEIKEVKDNFHYKEINTIVEVGKTLKGYKKEDTIIFTLFGFSNNSFTLYEEISKFDIRFGTLYVNPISKQNETIFDRIARIKSSYTQRNILQKVIQKIYFKINKKHKINIRPYDFIVIAGKVGNAMKENISVNTKVIKAHTLDMEFVIKDDSLNHIKDKYIVYLDSYLPYHSDFELKGINNKKIADIYYKKMNYFLDYLSKRYDKQVIICAHPRSEYSKHRVWKDKKIVLFQTYDYVKQAFICLTHASTSTNFAVMLNKPINFVYFKEIDFYKLAIKSASYSLGKEMINIDLPIEYMDNIDFTYINKAKYKEYIEDYITENIEDKRPFWEKVLKNLEK